MDEITRIAAFTGNEAIETAISERIQWTGDFIEAHGLKLPNGIVPSDDWAPAMFTPEAGMHGFDIRCSFDALLQDEQGCLAYGLPETVGHAVLLGLEGNAGSLEAFCQKVCDMSGMDCHMLIDGDDKYEPEKVLTCSATPLDTDPFISLMYDPDET